MSVFFLKGHNFAMMHTHFCPVHIKIYACVRLHSETESMRQNKTQWQSERSQSESSPTSLVPRQWQDVNTVRKPRGENVSENTEALSVSAARINSEKLEANGKECWERCRCDRWSNVRLHMQTNKISSIGLDVQNDGLLAMLLFSVR